MKRYCGAATKTTGEPCRNGWGCPWHRNQDDCGNRRYILAQQAREAARKPVQLDLWGEPVSRLTEGEIIRGKEWTRKIRAMLNKSTNTTSPCGCEGEGE